MKLKDYAEHINNLTKEYPELDVIYASDSEGNSFHRLLFTPTIGTFPNGEFKQISKDDVTGTTPTVVCIN